MRFISYSSILLSLCRIILCRGLFSQYKCVSARLLLKFIVVNLLSQQLRIGIPILVDAWSEDKGGIIIVLCSHSDDADDFLRAHVFQFEPLIRDKC